MAIEVEGISKFYGSQKALDEVSFSIPGGTVAGFLGPNGAGKSTLMRILTGYLSPNSGKAMIEGLDVQEETLEVRKRVGYLPENNPLYPEMYVKEYLEFVAGFYKTLPKPQDRIREVIQLTGLGKEQHKKIRALSKGYRQRVGLAQAILPDPGVLILDEPTTGLDPNQIVEIRQFIRDLGRKKTVLLSTHIMQEVEAICDHVLIIHNGRLVADQSVHDLQTGMASKSKLITAEFDVALDSKLLAGIPGVLSVHRMKGNQWQFTCTGSKDIRPDIFDFAVGKGIKVLSIGEKEQSLEEIFQEKTGKSPNPK